ncbi:hypothetical protein AC630_10820 [Bradyrhizobium sp. AS23.2]|nr:hypothetical protein AC630_10820 [Bradyrhizobium sp. AS23.2]
MSIFPHFGTARAPDAAQRLFDGALQSRGPRFQPCLRPMGPGSAEQRRSVSKTRVNALLDALHRVRDTRVGYTNYELAPGVVAGHGSLRSMAALLRIKAARTGRPSIEAPD